MTDDATPSATPRGITAEHARLAEATGTAEDVLSEANPWYEWGPYLSDPILKERMFESTVAGPARSPVADDRPTQDMSFERAGDDLIDGLFVGLDAWQWLLLRLDRSPERGNND